MCYKTGKNIDFYNYFRYDKNDIMYNIDKKGEKAK